MQKRNVHIIKININVWRGFFLSPLCSPVRITNIFYQIVARGWCALFIFILSPICAMIHASRARSIGQATKQPSTHVFKLHLQQFNWIRFFSISLATQSELTKLNKTLCKTKKKVSGAPIPLMNMHIHFYGWDFAFWSMWKFHFECCNRHKFWHDAEST